MPCAHCCHTWILAGWHCHWCGADACSVTCSRAVLKIFGKESLPHEIRGLLVACSLNTALGFSVRLDSTQRDLRHAVMLAAKDRTLRCSCENTCLRTGNVSTACAGSRCLHCRGCLACPRNHDLDVTCLCIPLQADCRHRRNPRSMG